MRVVLVPDEEWVDESAHIFYGDIRAFDLEHLRWAPVFEVAAFSCPDAAVVVSVLLALRCGICLVAHKPLVFVADDVAGT